MTPLRQAIIPRAPLLVGLVLLSTTLHIHAFLTPFVAPQRVDYSSKPTRRPSIIMTTTDASSSSSSSSSPPSSSQESPTTFSVHNQLRELADSCGNPNNDVILLASKCQDLFESNSECAMTVDCFHSVLDAWSHACATLAAERSSGSHVWNRPRSHATIPIYTARDAAERATTLLLDMEQEARVAAAQQGNDQRTNENGALCIPNTACYNTVIDAWSKSRVEDAPQACERLLQKLIHHDTLQPNVDSYNSVLAAWSHSESQDTLTRISKIYQHLEENSETDIVPTIQTINTILAAHAKQVHLARDKEAVAKAAHGILNETLTNNTHLEPTQMTYTSVMEAYSKCGTLQATLQVEQLLEQLQQASLKNPKLQPNTRTYTSLVTAWAKTKSFKAPHMAQSLLQKMEHSTIAKPNTRTYTAVIQAWGRSRDATKPQRVLRILKHMKAASPDGDNVNTTRPNIVTYNAAMEACARCQGTTKQQTEALKIAFAILKSMQLDPTVQPNHITFATVLKATAFLLPAGEERNQVASALFEKAKTAGMVDMNMVKNMRKAVDNNVMQDLFHELKDRTGHIDYNNIPPAWSRNIR